MASQAGYDDAGGFGEGIPADLRSRDLPSTRLLGKGLTSIGYETIWKEERYARIDFAGVPSDIFLREAAALVRLEHVHENVVKTYGLTVDKLSCSLVLEYMDDKLSDLLQKRKDLKCIPPFELPEAVNLMLQISKGMVYLHEQGILHGDLKTRNILVTYANNGDMDLAVKLVKVADFGRGQIKRNSMSNVSRQARKLDMVRWKAPEILTDATSSESDSSSDEECTRSSGVPLRALLSVDVYSFAVTCSQILTGEEPYPKRNWKELVAGIVSGKLRPKLPPSCPEMLSELLKQCWDSDPYSRPTFSYIREILDTLRTSILNESQEQNAYQLERIVEKDFTTDSSSSKPMEMVGPNSPVAKPFDADSSKMPKSEPDADRLLTKGKSLVWDQTGEPEENMSSELASLALGREVMGKFNDPIQADSRSDDLCSSDEFREPSLERKHRIFLSNNWAEKDFTWQLCKDLEGLHRFAFVDRYNDNVPKENYFLPLIIKATTQCDIVVLVLSDEFFFCSKWPMIALTEFIRAQWSNNRAIRVLPLFLGITKSECLEKERQVRWIEKWKEFAREDCRIDVMEWLDAFSTILRINGLHYNEEIREVSFRERVVESICKIVPPFLQYDVSHVQSLERLRQPIEKKLEEVEVSSRYNVQVVGLYGMGGVGKSTISKAICDSMFEKVNGNICHIEFGCRNNKELRSKVLQMLRKVDYQILNNIDFEHLGYLLKKRMHQQKVLLVLDNVLDNDIEEAHMYLRLGFHSGSMVLVTSRSRKVFEQLYIENCMEMPNLEEEGAFNMLLHYSGISKESIMERNVWQILQRCCFPDEITAKFSSHPLALKVLGSQLRGIELKQWDEILMELKDKFNMFQDEIHPVFPVLRQGYDILRRREQCIFLDLALIWAPKWNRSIDGQLHMDWECLCLAHSMTHDGMIRSVKTLQRKGLINEVNDITKLEYNIHDLYVEFAEAEARAGAFEERWILLDKDGTDVPPKLQMYPAHGVLSRLVIRGSKVKSMKPANLHRGKNVEVMVLHDCKELEEVDVTGMNNLRFMVVISCYKIRTWIGLQTLSNLVVFSHDGIKNPSVPMLESKMLDRSNLVVSSRGNKIPSVSMLEGKMIDHGERDDEVQGDESSG